MKIRKSLAILAMGAVLLTATALAVAGGGYTPADQVDPPDIGTPLVPTNPPGSPFSWDAPSGDGTILVDGMVSYLIVLPQPAVFVRYTAQNKKRVMRFYDCTSCHVGMPKQWVETEESPGPPATSVIVRKGTY